MSRERRPPDFRVCDVFKLLNCLKTRGKTQTYKQKIENENKILNLHTNRLIVSSLNGCNHLFLNIFFSLIGQYVYLV